ncbi:MAG: hypothetical protein H7Y86_06550 [Rhizobacter sp.]|nr:hypothetical protein [Ferruginibacter sp.]
MIAFLLSNNLSAQNIQGTWEGEMNGELLRVSIEQKGMDICGFTHDYVLRDSLDNCTAAYAGGYMPEQKVWMLRGTYFIRNSGSHVLMRLMLWEDARYGKNRLRARVTTGSSMSSLMGIGAYDVILRKVSRRPVKLAGGLPNCFPKIKKIPAPVPVPVKPAPSKPVAPAPVPPKPTPVVVKPTPKPIPPKPKPVVVQPTPKPVPPAPKPVVVKDSVRKPLPSPVKPILVKPDAELLRKMTERKQSQQSTLEVNVKQINLKVYDNGDIDNDTVSIFYNGKLLLSHQRLSDKPIIINLDLDENITKHTLTMYAENLGGIPPNTALIVVTAGDKRYELRSKANLEENAVLIFEYKPKEY